MQNIGVGQSCGWHILGQANFVCDMLAPVAKRIEIGHQQFTILQSLKAHDS
jgi:hypothetical protein